MILTEKIFDNLIIAMIYWFTSDVLAGVLGEGDVLSVDDGTAGDVVPARLISMGDHVMRIIRVVGEDLET